MEESPPSSPKTNDVCGKTNYNYSIGGVNNKEGEHKGEKIQQENNYAICNISLGGGSSEPLEQDKNVVLSEDKCETAKYPPIENDPILESYKSIINVINQTSKGFKEGKKWKCGAEKKSFSSSSKGYYSIRKHKRRRRDTMAHSKTIDEEYLIDSTSNLDMELDMYSGEGVHIMGGRNRKLLVRQKAHLEDNEESQHLIPASSNAQVVAAEVVNERPSGSHHLRVQQRGGLPMRQWTIDTCTGLKTPIQETALNANSSISTAYLLRPVSGNSLVSNSGANNTKEEQQNPFNSSSLSSQNQIKRVSPAPTMDMAKTLFSARSPVRDKIRLNDISRSAGCSFDLGGSEGTNKARPVLFTHPNRHRLIKQRTSESAPTTQPLIGVDESSGRLPRQHSHSSAFSAQLIPTSYSHQGITLVRGASCSLVDIPTYLGPSVAASGGVELAQMCDLESAICKTVPTATTIDPEVPKKPVRPRLQLDLTKKKHVKNNARKTQWTVLCVSLTLLTLSVTLVGAMLSIGSQYQEMVIAKQWETLSRNSTRSKMTTEEPFIIVPDNIDLIIDEEYDAVNGTIVDTNKDMENSDVKEKSSLPLVPIIFPPLAEVTDLLDIAKHSVEVVDTTNSKKESS